MPQVFSPNNNRTPKTAQEGRMRALRIWKAEYGVTWVEMGKYMTGVTGRPVSGNAVQKALQKERMPVENYRALREAFPHLPEALLPRPENVPPGPRPKAKKE